jgi:hypothetical protein
MITAMDVYIALIVIAGAIVWLLERTHRRVYNTMPRAPFGADREADADLSRIRHELELRRQDERAQRPR